MRAGRILVLILFLMATGSLVQGQGQGSQGKALAISQEEAQAVVEKDLQDRTKYSGTLDIFDATQNAVRNLRKIGFQKGTTPEDDFNTIRADFRDIKSGAIVTVAFVLEKSAEKVSVQEMKIDNVQELKAGKGSSETPQTFSDTQIQDFIKRYVENQGKFSGSMILFDEENNQPRSVKLLKLNEEIRRFGKLSICRGEFQDITTQEGLGVDITVENSNGILLIQSLRIREKQKPMFVPATLTKPNSP